MRFIFALMDSDGDGTVSLQEFQAAQEKIFKAMDTDHDDTVTLEDMQACAAIADKDCRRYPGNIVAACWADLIGARVSNPAAASKIYIAAGGVGVKQFREKKTNRIVAT